MLWDLLSRFHMLDYEFAPMTFLSGVKRFKPSVPLLWLMIHCLRNLLVTFCTKLIVVPIYPMQLSWFPSSCKNHMSFTEKLQREFFAILEGHT